MRSIVKRRISSGGEDIPCKEDAGFWFDIKETNKTVYKRGTGHAFQRTRYRHCVGDQQENKNREYEDPPIELEFESPEGEKVATMPRRR